MREHLRPWKGQRKGQRVSNAAPHPGAPLLQRSWEAPGNAEKPLMVDRGLRDLCMIRSGNSEKPLMVDRG